MRGVRSGFQTAVPLVTAIAVLLSGTVGAGVCGELASATNWNGSLNLVLDNGVRLRAKGSVSQCDLLLRFACRDGRWEASDPAWFSRMPALDHRVTLLSAEGDAETLRLEFDIRFASHAPVFAGGTGRYTVELRRALGVLRGEFSGALSGISDDSSTNLWIAYRGYALGSAQKPEWQTAIDAGRVCSLGRPGATVRAAIGPIPRRVAGHKAPAPGAHPRLLARQADMARLREFLSSAAGTNIAESTERALADAAGPWWRCSGSRAAGFGMLYAGRGDKTALDSAEAAALDAIADMRTNTQSMTFGRNMAGVALAYDMCVEGWPGETRRVVRDGLARGALRVAACLPEVRKADGLLAQGQLFSGVVAPHDYRLGYMRAAAGLAFIAVEGDVDPRAAAGDLAAADMAIAASVARLLAEGVGEGGEGTGNHGYADLVEVLFPYMQAYRNVRGVDLAADSGAERVAMLCHATRGACLQRGAGYPSTAWAPLAMPFARKEWLTGLHAVVQADGHGVRDPYHGAVAALNLAQFACNGGDIRPLPQVIEDKAMGSYVLGAGGGMCVYFRGGAGPDQAAGLRGDLFLYALGREWIAGHSAAPGDFSWPNASERNVMAIAYETKAGQVMPVVPRSAGRIDRIRFDRSNGGSDGSGSVCMRADAGGGWSRQGRRSAEVFGYEAGPAVGVSSWRTIGVDFSGASGADVLAVIIEGAVLPGGEFGRCWEMNTGNVDAESVSTGSATFDIRPGGTNVSMHGAFLLPADVEVTYLPPSEGKSGRIRAHLNRKRAAGEAPMEHIIRAKAPVTGVEPDLPSFAEPPRAGVGNPNGDNRVLGAVETLRRGSYSAPNPDQMATNACIVVLTVQQGDPPRVELSPNRDGQLLKVGGQTVFYEDSVIVFGRRRGE